MRFLLIIFLIAAATAAPTVGDGEDQKTKDSTPPAAATVAPPGAVTTTTHSDGNNEDQSTTQKSQSPQAAAENSHPEHTEAGNHKVGGHEQKVEAVNENAKEEAKEAIKEEAKEHVKKEKKKESMGEVKKEGREEVDEEVKGKVKEEVKEEAKEADKDDTDWEKRELKYKMDGQPVCAAKIEYKNKLSYGGNGYESVEKMAKFVSECEVGVDISTKRGTDLGTFYIPSVMYCATATCEIDNSDITHPLVGRPEGGQKPLRLSLAKTKEQQQKIQKFIAEVAVIVKEKLNDYNKNRLAEVYYYNDNRLISKALKIIKSRKENEAALKKALEKQKKEEEALAKQKKAAASVVSGATVEAEKPAAAAPEQPTSGDTKKPDV